ncbi:MAG: hypothetical protein CSB55_01710 [Candidatus Cloacimonadota bacterium]|nr:MAG: hypothetical protein CSB55_01710 [Candidatus Cloacimonadota bacterium]
MKRIMIITLMMLMTLAISGLSAYEFIVKIKNNEILPLNDVILTINKTNSSESFHLPDIAPLNTEIFSKEYDGSNSECPVSAEITYKINNSTITIGPFSFPGNRIIVFTVGEGSIEPDQDNPMND